MNCYTHSFRGAEAQAVAALPDFVELVQEEEAVKTGTDNGNCKKLAKILSAIGNGCL